MWNSLIGSIVKFITLFLLASNEQFGIMGVAIAISTGVVVITFLHLATLYKTINFTIAKRDISKMIILLVSTYLAGFFLKQFLLVSSSNLITFISILIILSIIYIVLLLVLRFITEEELKQIPYINKFFK